MKKLAKWGITGFLGLCSFLGADEKVSSRFASEFSIVLCSEEDYQVEAKVFEKSGDKSDLLLSPTFRCSPGRSANVIVFNPDIQVTVDVCVPEDISEELISCHVEIVKHDQPVYNATHTIDTLPSLASVCEIIPLPVETLPVEAEEINEALPAVAVDIFSVEIEEISEVPTAQVFEGSLVPDQVLEDEIAWHFAEDEDHFLPAQFAGCGADSIEDELESPLNWFFASLETDINF